MLLVVQSVYITTLHSALEEDYNNNYSFEQQTALTDIPQQNVALYFFSRPEVVGSEIHGDEDDR